MRFTRFSFGFVLSSVAALGLITGGAAVADTTITFDEPVSIGTGFLGHSTQLLHSSDGLFRAETFWLPLGGHFHIGNNLPGAEGNHNEAQGSGQLQGIRFTRVDGQPFDLLSMDLAGQVSIGQLTDTTTGAGTWSLFSTPVAPLTNISFGSQFTNRTELFLADPFAAGGTEHRNAWDNIVLGQANIVPEPGTMALLGIGALPLLRRLRRRQTEDEATL